MVCDTVFETERLLLEPLVAAHAAELFDALCDEELYRFVPQDPPTDLATLAERYRRLETRTSPDESEDWLNWAVRAKASGVCVGRVQSTVRRDGSALFAYEFAREFHGQGFASEACERVVEHLFTEHGVERLVAEVDTRNVASMRLLARLGFERGETRQNADFFKGLASHEFVYSLERRD